MTFMNWKDEYNLSIPTIDEQHRVIVGLINQLHDAMRAGKGKDALNDILEELAKYSHYHFQTEERLMADSGYRELLAHRSQHKALTEEVRELARRHATQEALLSMEVMDFLQNWLITHILKSDRAYAVYMNSLTRNAV